MLIEHVLDVLADDLVLKSILSGIKQVHSQSFVPFDVLVSRTSPCKGLSADVRFRQAAQLLRGAGHGDDSSDLVREKKW